MMVTATDLKHLDSNPGPGYIRRMFHLLLRLITFGGPLADFSHVVQKSGCKTAIFIIIIMVTI